MEKINECLECIECQSCIECQIVGSNFGQTQVMPNQQVETISNEVCNQSQQQPIQPNNFKIRELTLWNTGRCNFKCDYCFSYNIYEKVIDADMQDRVIEALPNFIQRYCVPNGSLWFFGAEPLMSFDTIKKIVKVVSSKFPDFRFGLTTNGSLLANEEIAKFLGEVKFGILFSLDGWGESHNLHRKFKDGTDTFPQVLEGLKNTRYYITSNPQIRWTYTPKTVSYLFDNFRKMIEFGLTSLACEPVYEIEWTDYDIRVLKEQMQKIGEEIVRLRGIGITVNLKPFIDTMNAIFENQQTWKSRCGIFSNMGGVGVDVDGSLYPCHRYVSTHDKSLSVGDIFSGFDFNKVNAFNRKWLSHRHYSEVKDRCKTCKLYNTCIGGCIALNFDLFKDEHICCKSFCDIRNAIFDTLLPYVIEFKLKYGMLSGQPINRAA